MQPKLLITDDDPTSFFILSAIAKSVADIECDHAPDGATAVELVKKTHTFSLFLIT
jgi:DNA-binding response OmpR family regulator